jgi:hypothetical protein
MMLVVGKREAEEGKVSIRRLGSQEQTVMGLGDAVALLQDEAIPPDIRKVGAMELQFPELEPRLDFERDVVFVWGQADRGRVKVAVSREALDDKFEAEKTSPVKAFEKGWPRILEKAQEKLGSNRTAKEILLTTSDF